MQQRTARSPRLFHEHLGSRELIIQSANLEMAEAPNRQQFVVSLRQPPAPLLFRGETMRQD